MVIECSSCHARFKLADDKIKTSGTKVRCTKCREVFTVYPETSPTQSALTPAVESSETPPVETTEQGDLNSLFSENAPQSSTPFTEDDSESDWAQNDATTHFTDDSSANIGATDLDAISFDNIESPVFSVTTENNKLEFDDHAFSFTENPPAEGESFSEQINNDSSAFDTDLLTTPSPLAPNKDSLEETQSDVREEFTFTPTENLADFSWDEVDSSPVETVPSEKLNTVQAPPQDSNFDFSSFSFDDVAEQNIPDKADATDNIPSNEGNFELATEPLPSASISTNPQAQPHEQKVFHNDSQEIPRASVRHLRGRSRTKKKGSSRFLIRAVFFILLIFGLIFGFLNREQIYTEYKNIVSRFIEKQVTVETSGRISLANLSGSYLVNNQNENMFVIRGDAVNDYKGLRSSVLVRGTIYDEKGAVLQSQTAYCGNPIKDVTLKRLSLKEIRYAMNNELGENLVNLNIASGKSIPFVIVFNGVPKSIKEFTVEVLESKQGSK